MNDDVYCKSDSIVVLFTDFSHNHWLELTIEDKNKDLTGVVKL